MTGLPVFELGHPRTELRRQLVDAVLRGEKTATAGLLEEYEAEGEQPDQVGARCTLLGYDNEPVAVVEVTESRVLPAAEIDEQFARDEGEGFETVDDWREAHEHFFGCPIEPETQPVPEAVAEAPDTTTSKKQVEDPTKLEKSGDPKAEKKSGKGAGSKPTKKGKT